VITYDSLEVLQRFTKERGITYPLIADPGSTIIRRFGLLNETIPTDNRAFGIPWPGTFIIGRDGRVRSRFFEEAYQERNTVASIMARTGTSVGSGPAVTRSTPHLRVTAGATDDVIAPGSRFSIVFEVTPGPTMHVYAPGRHTYQVVTVELDAQPWLRTHPVTYPPSEIYHFKPLDEHVEVYLKPFRLVKDVTIAATPEAQKQLGALKTVTLTGRLQYQACDDEVCYLPATVPLSWTLEVRPLVR
jgi:hypothetical protein